MATRASISAPARAAGSLLLGALLLAACEFEVVNPGRVLEEDLNDVKSVEPLVTGMSSDFSTALDDMAFLVARASDEMAGGGSYSSTGEFRVGMIEYDFVDWEWEAMSRARWVAEDGLRRMQDITDYDFEGNPLTARAYLFLGLSNRALGESYCDVVYDGGGPEAPAAAFQRAVDAFTEARDHAQLAGATDIELAAFGGLAQAYVGLADWTNAVNNANQVPTDFVYEAFFHNTSGREENELFDETHRRHEMTAYLTYADSVDPQDPRAPFTDCTVPGNCPSALGADGLTPHYRQEKYQDLGADVPVVKGTEMRLIEAEAQLVQNGAAGIAAAIASVNEVRDFWGLTLIDPTGMTLEDAWVTMDHERHLTLWLEGRRFFDIRRWDVAGLDYLPAVMWIYGGTLVYQGENPRDVCIPVSRSECITNVNVKDTPACP